MLILLLFFLIVLKISGEFAIAVITDPSVLAGRLLTQICNDWQNINAV